MQSYEQPWTQTPNPQVPVGNGGMANPRVCDMAAVTGDVGFDGCEIQTKYVVPVYPGKRAVTNPPIGGLRSVPVIQNAPNTYPQAGRGDMVYIPFAYSQQPQHHHHRHQLS